MNESPTPQAEATPKKRKNQAIQGLRGFAAFTVMVHHVFWNQLQMGFVNPNRMVDLQRFAVSAGSYSVCLFFCISGFLITHSLIRHANVPEFFKNRAIRIYPAFLTITLILFLLGFIVPGIRWVGNLDYAPHALPKELLQNLFFVPGVLDVPRILGVQWSLSYEALFYVLSAASYLAFVNVPSKDWKRMCFGGLCGVFALIGTVLFIRFHHRSLYFLDGIAVYFLFRPGQVLKIPRFFTYFDIPLLITAWDITNNYKPISIFLTIFVFAMIVNGQGVFARFLETKFLRWLGDISYSLYLAHPIAILLTIPMLTVSVSPDLHIALMVAQYAVVPCIGLLLGWTLYTVAEKKLTSLLFPPRARPVATGTPSVAS